VGKCDSCTTLPWNYEASGFCCRRTFDQTRIKKAPNQDACKTI
jgi:hypothetical protein